MLRRFRQPLSLPLLAVAALGVLSCREMSVTAVEVTTVRIEPDSVAVSVGSTVRLEATAVGAGGDVLAGRSIAWSSADPTIAIVDAAGVVTALQEGRTTITAMAQGVRGDAIFVATPAPAIAVDPGSLAFSAVTGGPVPDARTAAVRNAGTGTLAGLGTAIVYGDGAPVGWLTASLDRTMAPATLTAAVARTTLPEGDYAATIRVSTISGEAVDVPVTFTSEPPPPSIVLDGTVVAFAAVAGGVAPPAREITVTNGGGRSLTGLAATVVYADGQPDGWLDASLDGMNAPAILSLSVRTTSLAAGTYRATVQVLSPVAENSPRSIEVSLEVGAAPEPPTIALSRNAVSFGATAGSDDPAQQSVQVTNGGGGVLSGLTASIAYAEDQPTGWLSAVPGSTTAPTAVALNATTGGLAAGAYAATVTINSPVAQNPAQTVAVTFTIAPAPVPPPRAPSNLDAAGKKGGKIEVTWQDRSSDETSFVLQQATTSSGPWTDIVLPANTEKHVVEGLQKGERLWFRVRACNAGGCSDASNVDSDTAG